MKLLSFSTGRAGPVYLAILFAVSGCERGLTDKRTAEALLAHAVETAESGQPQRAVVELREVAKRYPQNAAVRWHLGRQYLMLGAPERAEAQIRKALDLDISLAIALPDLVRVLRAKGDHRSIVALEVPGVASPELRAHLLARQAVAHAALQEFAESKDSLAQAQSLAPDDEQVRLAEAELLLAQDMIARGEARLRALTLDFPGSAEGLARLADVVRDQGQLEAAESLYGRALDLSEHKLHLHFLRAEVRLDLVKLDAARADLSALEAWADGSFATLYIQGRMLLLQGRADEALTSFEAAQKLDPSHVGTLLYGGVAAHLAGRSNLSEDWLNRVLKERPRNAGALLFLGAIRFGQQRYDDAERLLRPVPAAMPGNPVPRRLLAASLIAQDRAAEAVPLLSELVVTRPDDLRSQLDLAVALVLSGAKGRGVAALDGLVARHPDYRPAYAYLIAYHVRERQWVAAERWANRFAEQYPDDPQPQVFRGEVLLQAGRAADAQRVFEDVLRVRPTHADANLRLAALALERGDSDAATAHFARILEHDPQHLDAVMGQAKLAADSKRVEDAVGLLEAAVSVQPNALAPRMMLARLLLSQGEAQRAATALRGDASRDFRRHPAYLRLLTESLMAAEAPQQAAEAARELVVLQPSSLDAYGLYARVLTLLDDKVALENTLKQMLTIEPTHIPTRLELVRLNIATGHYTVGERLLRPLLQSLDRPPLADLLYGLILTATDRSTQAVAPLMQAHRRLGSQQTLLALANAEALSGRPADAIARERDWLAQHPDDIEVRVNLAGHLADAAQVSEAISEYRRVAEARPDHLVALNNLAWHTLAQDPRQAAAYARRALEAEPNSLEVAHTLATAEVEAGEWRNAELTLDRALARYPTDSGLLWLSARVLHHKGQGGDALQKLEWLLDHDLPDAERERAQVLLTQIQDELRAQEAQKSW